MSSFFKALLNRDWAKIEKQIGGLKFAVFIILAFAFFMITGTLLESYFGTDFANRVIYKRWPFMLLQFFMFLSILFATFLRLPPKKRLYGFYVIHTGLILIGCGAFVTYYSGIDGSLFLPPQDKAREVVLNEDILTIHFVDDNKMVQRKLPYTAFKTSLEGTYQGITFMDYFPYSERKFEWKKPKANYEKDAAVHSGRYLIANNFTSQEITLSLHPENIDFDSSASMGPLTVHYMPFGLARCFDLPGESGLIIWDQNKGLCFTPEERNIPIKSTSEKNRFLAFKENGKIFSFFPDISPWPMDEKVQVQRGSPLRIFSKKLFEKKPNLFLFGTMLAYFDKNEQKWFTKNFKENDTQDLPWMGSTIKLLAHKEDQVPVLTPIYTYPIQKSGTVIKGNEKALKLSVHGESYWLTDSRPLSLLINGKKVTFRITKESVTLPFEFELTRFKMDKNPGTNRPASFESFVTLYTPNGPKDHHVYMNHPLKYRGFTFYQASFSQGRDGRYSSTLTVNVDPGRPIKYFGCLLLIFGAIWHYQITKRLKKLKTPSSPLEGGMMVTPSETKA